MEACQETLNDRTSEQLVSESKTSCFYIPNRLALISLAFIKLVLSFGLLVLLYYTLLQCNLFGHSILLYHIILWLAISIDVIDVIIGWVIIVSVCLNNRRIMKMYYIYSICVIGPLIFLCCVIYFLLIRNLIILLIFFLIFFLFLMLQEYLNHLVKREVRKLESSEQFSL